MTMDTHDTAAVPATSRAVVVGLGVGLAVALLLGTGVAGLVPVVAGAGLALALTVWLVGWRRWTAVGRLLASLLAAPTGAAVVAVAAGAVAAAPDAPAGVVAATVVSLGCLLAVFGAVTVAGGGYDRERTVVAVGVVGRTALPLAVAAVASVAARALRGAAPLAPVVDPLFRPAPGRTHVGVFCLSLAVATVVFERALRALPLTELLADAAGEDDVADALASASSVLLWGSLLAVGVGLLGLLVELVWGQAAIAGRLPPAGYDILVAVTGSPVLRDLLWLVLLASSVVRLAVWLVRRAARQDADRAATVLAPSVGGSLLAAGLLAVAAPLFARLRSAAPDGVASTLTAVLGPPAESYGAGPVLLAVGVALLGVAGCVYGGLWLAVAVSYLDERTPGVHLAAAGLFGATVFGATRSAPTPLVLAGLVGSVVVWDAGTFGWTLRREVGTAGTRRAELTHTGATLAVGGVGVALTLAVRELARGTLGATAGVGYVTLLVALAALVALLVSLR